MTTPTVRRSPLAMMVLSLLAEAPMHPYRMQQLFRERDKESVVNVASRNSIHQVVRTLVRDDLAVARGTSKPERGPRRTVYEITPAGEEALAQWLTSVLSTPRNEYPNFPAALSLVVILTTEQVEDLLAERARILEEELSSPDPETVGDELGLPRVFLIEDEYRRAMLEAEFGWVRVIIDDLRTGRLSWPDPRLGDDAPTG